MVKAAPTFVQYCLARHLEVDVLHASHYCGGGKLAVRIEDGDEAACNEVIDVHLHVGEVASRHSRGNDGVVVGHLRRIKHSLRLLQRLSSQRSNVLAVAFHQSLKCLRTLGINVVAKVLRIDTRISGEFLFVKSLYDVERLLGTHRIFLVAVNLQRCKVVELRRLFRSVLLLYIGDGEGLAAYCLKEFLSVLLFRKLTFCGSEHSVAVGGGENPICFGLKLLYLLLTIHY